MHLMQEELQPGDEVAIIIQHTDYVVLPDDDNRFPTMSPLHHPKYVDHPAYQVSIATHCHCQPETSFLLLALGFITF